MAKKIFLIDGSNHAFRVFFALPRMTAGGINTGALLGFSNMLRKFETELKPDYVVVVFDKGKSFRSDLYPDYKGHRPEMPPELREQWPLFTDLVEAWGYPCLAMAGLEADDVIGTLARRFASPDLHVSIVSGDKDFYQLIDENISILDVMKDKTIRHEGVHEKFGVAPEQVIDVLALMGDSSDNVPGVTGIGGKTATKLIQEYGSLEAVLEDAVNIKGKRGENLRNEADIARLSQTLVTIVTDADLELTLESIEERPRDTAKLRELFMKWQFRTHLKHLESEGSPDSAALDRSIYRTVRTPEALSAAMDAIRGVGRCAFDTETTSLNKQSARLVGLCFCWSAEDAIYVPMNHVVDGQRAPDQMTEEEVMAIAGPVLLDPAIGKIGQNLKYDLSVLRTNGYDLRGIVLDTMIADYVLEPDRNRHNLDDLSLRYLGHSMIAFSEATKDIEGNQFALVPIDQATLYAAEDAHVCWLLAEKLVPALQERELMALVEDLELPLLPILAEMEANGMGVDADRLGTLAVEFERRIEETQARVYFLAGREFSINSPKQLQKILFEERGLKPLKKTKTGFSTDADTLELLADVDPLPAQILQWRALSKLKSTYVDTLPLAIAPTTGRIHTSFHQAVAATGRLASNNPNMQNIPIRSDDGKRIRDCFVAREGHVFLSCDYSQVELRLLAHYCEEGPLVEAFRQGQDIHSRTASEIFGIAIADVTSHQRSAAKAINFGIVYGMSAFRLARELRIPQKEAAAYLEGYFARYPQVKKVHAALIEAAREHGYAETLWGRRRPIPDIHSSNGRDRQAAERLALNTPLQGSAADLIKRAMLAVHARLRRENLPAHLLLQVHDELLLEVPHEALDLVTRAVQEEMEGAATLHVPLKVDAGNGATWAAAH